MTEQSKGLLVLKLSSYASDEVLAELTQQITPTAEKLGVEPTVLPFGVDVELKMGSEALLLRVCEALEKIATQGEAPDVNVADMAPQGLNARPSSLNSRDPKIYPANNGGKPEAPAAGDPLPGCAEPAPLPRDSNYQPRTEPYGSTGSGGLLVKPRG